MSDGRGDIAASNIPIIPELQKIVDFSDPVRTDAKEIIVTGPSAPAINTLDDAVRHGCVNNRLEQT